MYNFRYHEITVITVWNKCKHHMLEPKPSNKMEINNISTFQGCFFHFIQYIWRKIQYILAYLVCTVRQDGNMKKMVDKVAVLPLVRINEIS